MMGYTSIRTFEDLRRRAAAGTLMRYELYIEEIDDAEEFRDNALEK